MPLSKYHIRNEHSLADPELYRSADKDDPEALLEGVSMAALVGLLRQLGDLAEFAAQIFHNLHEEVMVTAARGHCLMDRVQQLEAEVPSLEKAFYSQTHHSSFFTSGGIGWHPNLRSEQNLVTHGDMPRFIMDSYEECRGPPRLFLLDKFDVAGAGACLKRYTDPSFFKIELASIATGEVHRGKRIRKVKKKGARLRDGEAPIVQSHSKLHQLLLEDRIENGYSNPARLVRLKKRQLNGHSAETEAGKCYMEKFLETPSPAHKMIFETSLIPLPLKLPLDDTSEAGIRILEISSINPVKNSFEYHKSPNEEELELKPFSEVNGETYGDLPEAKEQISLGVTDEMSSSDPKLPREREVTVHDQTKIRGSLDGYHSDDVASEVDNYMDALTTMDSELETDNEWKPKKGFLSIQKVTDTDGKEDHQLQARFSDSQSFGDSSTSDESNSFKEDRNGEKVQARLSDSHSTGTSSTSDSISSVRRDGNEHVELLAHFSDSQSFGNSSTSDENNSFKKDPSCFTHSASLSTVVENTPSESVLFRYAKYHEPQVEDTSSNQIPLIVEFQNTDCGKVVMHDDANVKEESSDSWQASSDLVTTELDLCSASPVTIPVGTQSDEIPPDPAELNLRLEDNEDRTGLVESISAKPISLSLLKDDAFPVNSSDKKSVDNLEDDDPYVHSDDLEDLSPVHPVNCFNGEVSSGLILESPNDEPCSAEIEVLYSDLQSKMVHSDEIRESTCSVDPFDGNGCYKNQSSPDNLVMVNDVVTENIQSEDQAFFTVPSVDNAENDAGIVTCPPSGLINSPSRSLSDLQELLSGSSDSFKVAMELAQIFIDSNKEKGENPLEPSTEITSSDTIFSPMTNVTKSVESFSSFEDLHEKEMEVSEAIGKQKTVDKPELACADVQLNLNKPVPCYVNDSEGWNNIQSSAIEQFSHSAFVDDLKMLPEFSRLDTQQSESIFNDQNDLLQNGQDNYPSSSCNQMRSETNAELFLQSQIGEQDTEFLPRDEENFASEKSQSQQMQRYRSKQENIHATSEFAPEIYGDGPSSSYSSGQEINTTKNVMDPLKSPLPDFFPKATEDNLDVIPPMPPLPPMQWRMGKLQHASLFSKREEVEVNWASVQAMQPIKPDKKSQPGFPTSERDTLLHQSQFLPVMAVESDNLQHSGFPVGVSRNPVAIPLKLPIMVNDAIGQYNYVVLDRNQIQNPFLTSPVVSSGRPPHDYIVASEREMVQNSKLCSPILPAEFAASGHDSISPPENLCHPPSQFMSLTSSEVKTTQHSISNVVSTCRPPNGYDGDFEGEMLPSSNQHLKIPPAECDVFGHDSIAPQENLIQSPSQLMLETSSEVKTLEQSISNVVSMGMAPHGYAVTSEGEMVQNSNSLPPVSPAECSVSGHDSTSIQESPTHPPSQLMKETSLEVKTLQSMSNAEGEQGHPSMLLMSPPNMGSMEPNRSFLPSMGEMPSYLDTYAQTSDFESERINGKPKNKLPRPRNPLIDAVVAHDKSKLRKVTERVVPQIAPNLEERDSLLEQIRTRSFNLRPAVATRPSFQGPKTNLKLAAILEKANAIRQAFAGSDEDDDADSWSDS
ncbi:PREDICTED: protein SCAR2-like isoform X2 [Lupinus angustifolius]|uniref:protein SCAR2-like isoform X2 n=1 Tax=Lupinus angustifolius TaxID=3871 RepID=UPI00092E6BF6|nr:PREDICTED: protein SCAR2-like isoform X2 [Lupinus angustifolius]